MKKLSVATVLLLALILGSTVVYAGFNWDGDPIFKVEGTIVKVLIGADEEFVPSEVSVVLRVPKGVEARIVSSHDFACEIVHRGRANDDGIPVEVTVLVPGDAGSSVVVTVQVPKYGISESRDGRTGRSIKVELEIPND